MIVRELLNPGFYINQTCNANHAAPNITNIEAYNHTSYSGILELAFNYEFNTPFLNR